MTQQCLYCRRSAQKACPICFPPKAVEVNVDRAQLSQLGNCKDRAAQQRIKELMSNPLEKP